MSCPDQGVSPDRYLRGERQLCFADRRGRSPPDTGASPPWPPRTEPNHPPPRPSKPLLPRKQRERPRPRIESAPPHHPAGNKTQPTARVLRSSWRAPARDAVLATYDSICAPRVPRDGAAFSGRLPVQRPWPSCLATLGRIFIINKRVKLKVSSTRCSIFATSKGVCHPLRRDNVRWLTYREKVSSLRQRERAHISGSETGSTLRCSWQSREGSRRRSA